MSASTTLHHGMTKRELARHISEPLAPGHDGRWVGSANVSSWYIGEIEHTHAEFHAAQHLKDEASKAIAMLGLEEV